MKNNILSLIAGTAVIGASLSAPHAHALSCLSIDMYLDDVIGKEEVVIFTATSLERRDEKGYTSEVLSVTGAKQGYIEKEIFVYHEKDETWGYLCNNGPKEEGSEGVYVATRSEQGTYTVTQRLEMNDPLIKALDADLKKEEVTGEIVELSKTDRMNQIMTTISDLFTQIGVLLKEYAYWKN